MTPELTSVIFEARFSGKLAPRERVVLDMLCGEVKGDDGHFGRNEAITGPQIREKALQLGVRMDRRMLSDAVATLIETWHIPIGTSKGAKGSPAGYFLTVSDEDQEKAFDELWAQIRSMIRRARVLSPKTRHGRQLVGQLAAEFEEAA
jgi:hypothetical protein